MADIPQIINNLLNTIVWPIFSGVTIIAFIFAGILFLTANGEPGKITRAKQVLIWGIIGVIVAFASVSISFIIQDLLGI